MVDEFTRRTGTIHTWCHFGTVSVEQLLAELRFWIDYYEPARISPEATVARMEDSARTDGLEVGDAD